MLNEQQKALNDAKLAISRLQSQIILLQNAQVNLVVNNSIQMGAGSNAFKADRRAFWWGPQTLEGILSDTPIPGTAILMDGTIYAKGGATGSFAGDGGAPTVTVSRGIVVSIA